MRNDKQKIYKITTLLFVFISIYSNNLAARTKNRHNKRKSSTHSYYSPKLLNSKYTSWGISNYNNKISINLESAWKIFKKKKNIVVAVIDTGIDANHTFLKNNLYRPKEAKPHQLAYGVDFTKNAKNKFRPFDTNNHGTHVSGIIKSIFPDVKISVLKYYDPQATIENLNSTIAALKYAIHEKVDIINYSGGGKEPSIEELKLMKLASKNNILIVAAAGNEKSNLDLQNNSYYPASYGLKNIISVTAYDTNLHILKSSNYGKSKVDIAAPGYRIKSSIPYDRAGFLTGTSQATAFVTGVAALVKSEFPSLKASEIKQIIIRSAKKISQFKDKCLAGGKLSAVNAINQARKYYNRKRHIQLSRKIAQIKQKIINKSRQTKRNKKIILLKSL